MGYRSWQQLGRYVKKEERAIRIWAPMRVGNKEERRSGEAEENLIFRPVCVFDLSQTDGKPLAELSEVGGEPGEYLEKLKRFAQGQGIKLGYEKDLSAEGVSKCGEILLRLGLDPAVEFHVLAHEIAHELLHTKEKRKTTTKEQKETEAEAVAFVVSKTIGLNTGNSASDYIQIWDGNKETVIGSLVAIQQTAARITRGIVD